MEVSSNIEELSAISKQVKVSIPAQEAKSKYEAEMAKVTKSASLKGFRAGKAPRSLVEKLYGERVKFDVMDDLVSESLRKIVKDKDWNLVGTPKFELKNFEIGSDLEYTATIEIFPTPEVQGYDKFSVRVQRHETKEAEIEQIIERIRQSRSTLRKIEDRTAAKDGDVVDATVEIKVAGDEGKSRPEPQAFELGKGRLPKDVEQKLVGAEVGKTVEIQSHIPEDYRDANLRGKDATYVVTVNVLHEKILPEFNDEFVKSVNPETQSVADFRKSVKESLDQEHIKHSKGEIEFAIIEELVKANQFDVPQALVDDEIRSFVARSGMVDQKKIDIENIPVEPFREGLGEIALKRVRGAILINRIAEKEKIQANEEEYKARIKELALENHMSEKDVSDYFAKHGGAVNVLLEITRQKVMKMLSERTQVEYYEAEEEKKD